MAPDRPGVLIGLGGVVFSLVVRPGGVGDVMYVGILLLAVLVQDVEQCLDMFPDAGPGLLAVFVPEVEVHPGPFYDLFQFYQVMNGVVVVSAEIDLGQ